MILLSRAVARTTAGLPRPQVLPGTTYIAGCYRCHRLDSVRQFNIRAVTVTEGPYKSIPKPTPSFQALLRDEWSKEQATVPAGDLLHFTPRQGASVDSVKIVEKWRSGLILPPGEYWNKWTALLKDYEVGGLLTAQKFVQRWCDRQPETAIHVREETKGETKISQCTFEVPVPMLGLRRVISYGCSRVSLRLLGSRA